MVRNAKGPARLYIEDLCRTYPATASKTLASMARRNEPLLFTSVEHARSVVRTVRGNRGAFVRSQCSNKNLFRSNDRTGGNWKDFLPKPKEHFSAPWGPVEIPGPHRALVLSDIHCPYHDAEALQVAISHGRQEKCDLVLLNGDTLDCFSLSRWEKDPRQRDFVGEIEAGRKILEAIRRAFPKARIVFKWGNHEERWDAFMRLKAPEFLGVEDFSLENVLRFEQHGIESVKEMRPIRLGKLSVIHGHEYRFNISNPVNPARGFYLRAKVHVLGSHLHSTSHHAEADLDGHVTSAFSIGCLCGLHPDYAPLNKWNHGFAVVVSDKSGAFDVSNYRIVGGKVYR